MPDASPTAHNYAFASDNTAGVCPEVLAALAEANRGHVPSYGHDRITHEATDRIRALFETDCEVFFVYNGTAANALSLASICSSYHAILAHADAHVERDECAAPEFFSGGARVVPLPGSLGKLSPDVVDQAASSHHEVHASKPRVLSLTQSTEWGTVYSPAAIAALTATARRHNLAVHLDGARFANAAAALRDRPGATPADLTWRAGVDVLSFGGTKNGAAGTEAIVFFNRSLAAEFAYRRKQSGQLASKMRFLAAQWLGLLRDDAWLRHAAHANAMAARLGRELGAFPALRLLAPVEANAVFVELPPAVAQGLFARGWHFYAMMGEHGYRLMCSWATQPADLDAFLGDLRAVVSAQ
ncbi:threonine aldolase [Horticoccus luteus]|uniref:L-threonine aldolase n=1 Tax=Horticoccus luteus TaxID=2862869 RepID=A0A8F9TY05_9BACT|nr:beta-eliminating lyase-related protein [Horticoccus luteus]QYM79939.1 threonine aldolase [Horticoccus luteus]